MNITSPSCYSRCETFNSFIRAQNIYGNKAAPRRDIAQHFSTIEQLRYICDGGYIKDTGYLGVHACVCVCASAINDVVYLR